ncbi:hypothetical protein A4X09_0g3926 [Tilletia walkeri]|uniref:Methyltransferase type 11 domain-containing protein n=1 Tax=Tilletia walkeri TaxID=117179 RepID=A0A8X7N8Q1_9BASI|nr:hypothetical protein A4X09_0g3926 [Tilletia walkeri]
MSSTSQLFRWASRSRPVLNSTGLIVPAARPSTSRLPCSSAQCLRRTYASATSPPPSPPGTAPAPPQLFDRNAKLLQRSRAALGSDSREVDYVREMVAESVGERVKDVKKKVEVLVDLGSGAGLVRKFLEGERMGLKKVLLCDSSEAMLYRDTNLDETFSFETERILLDEENPLLSSNVSPHLAEGTVDMVISAGSLHWTNDLLGTLIQIRRMLKPDGVFIGAMAGGDTLFELRTSLQLAEMEREGGVSPRVSPMADSRDMASLLTRAGFTLPTVDVDELTVRYPSSMELMTDLRLMGESNAVAGRRTLLQRDTLLASVAIYEALHKEGPRKFKTPDGQVHEIGGGGEEAGQVELVGEDGYKEPEITEGVPATFNIIYMIGWAPSETQRKPLSRGSAKTSLKDVLDGSTSQS